MKTKDEKTSMTARVYEIEVKQTDFYSKSFTVTAESEKDARQMIRDLILEKPLASLKNTYDTTEIDMTVIPKHLKVHTVEALFNINEDECDVRVILLDDLTDEQRAYLGIDLT
jgi:hypothetical protein